MQLHICTIEDDWNTIYLRDKAKTSTESLTPADSRLILRISESGNLTSMKQRCLPVWSAWYSVRTIRLSMPSTMPCETLGNCSSTETPHLLDCHGHYKECGKHTARQSSQASAGLYRTLPRPLASCGDPDGTPMPALTTKLVNWAYILTAFLIMRREIRIDSDSFPIGAR